MTTVGVLLALVGGQALAQQPTQAQTSAIRSSCRSDYQANCADVPTGGRAALACLQQHAANLSPPCHQAVEAVGGGGAAGSPQSGTAPPPRASTPRAGGGIREACGADYRALCRGIRPGGGRALSCLSEHRASLSPGCGEALGAMRQGR